MTGTLINIVTVLVGGILGLLLGNRLPERLKATVIAGLGLFTLAYGIKTFLVTTNSLIVLGSVLIGGLVGEALRIEDGLHHLGEWLERRFSRSGDGQDGRFIRGFLTASLVFCVGPMTILGAIQDGLVGDSSTLVTKAVLDGFGALAFASSLGVGVLFSSLIILFYQGGISLLASQVSGIMTDPMMLEMTATGGVLLMGVSISSLLEIKKIRVANFLPALIIAPLIVALVDLISR